MASNSASTSLKASGATNAYTLALSFTEGSPSEANNTSIINVSGSFTANGSYWSSSYYSTLAIYWYDDNQHQNGTWITQIDFAGLSGNYDSKSVNGSITVSHKADGTLNGYAMVRFLKGNTTTNRAPSNKDLYTPSTVLTTIARKTSCPSMNGTIGSSCTVYLNPASSSFFHTIRYAFGSLSGTFATYVYGSATFTIPNTFYAQIPNSKTGTGTIYVDTYTSAGAFIGTTSNTMTINCNASNCIPTIDFTVKDVNENTIALTDNENILILNRSNAQLTITKSAKNNASINALYVNGAVISASTDVLVINNVSTSKFTIKVVDSRGYENSKTVTLDKIDYISLTCNVLFERIGSTTGKVGLIYSGNYYNGSFGDVDNTLEIKYAYRQKGTPQWSEPVLLTPVINTENNTYSQTIELTENFDYKKTYEFMFFYKDKLTNLTISETPNTTISQGIPTFWWNDEKFVVEGDFYLKVGNEIKKLTDLL